MIQLRSAAVRLLRAPSLSNLSGPSQHFILVSVEAIGGILEIPQYIQPRIMRVIPVFLRGSFGMTWTIQHGPRWLEWWSLKPIVLTWILPIAMIARTTHRRKAIPGVLFF